MAASKCTMVHCEINLSGDPQWAKNRYEKVFDSGLENVAKFLSDSIFSCQSI